MQIDRVSDDGSFFSAAVHAAMLARHNLGGRAPEFAAVDVAGACRVFKRFSATGNILFKGGGVRDVDVAATLLRINERLGSQTRAGTGGG